MTAPMAKKKPRNPLRARLHEIIFEADTKAGRIFDLALIWCILISVLAVMLDSVTALRTQNEYLLRLWSIGKPMKYATSFYGVVDLLAILPTYLSLFLPGTQYLLVIRILRVLRIFRVLKLVQFMAEAQSMSRALRASGRKLAVFFSTIIAMVVVFGSVMYIVEGEANGFP